MAEEPRVRRSATGRVPQWAMDEAVGKPVEPVPFRSVTTLSSARRRRGRRRAGRALTFVVIVAVCVTAVYFVGGFKGTLVGATGSSRDLTVPPPGKGESRHRLLAAPVAPTETEGARYRFLQHQHGSKKPITWDPCRPIHYVVRPDHAPPGGNRLLTGAFAQISRATGLKFVNDGTTTEAPVEDRESFQVKRYGVRWAPVYVVWATKQEVPDFGVEFAGEAGPVPMTTASGDATYVTGTVSLSVDYFNSAAAAARPAEAREIVLHELGHLVGLAHSPDTTQVMFPRGSGRPVLGAGDLAGLAALGRGSCQPDV